MKRILFVEDNTLIACIYSQKLESLGFEVTVALDGLEAVKLLAKSRPDVVVLDLLMPKMTGADVLKYIRQDARLRDTPVIVFSNSFLSNLVEQVSSMKVEATLVKAAVTPARLAEIISTTLDQAAQQKKSIKPSSVSNAMTGIAPRETKEPGTESDEDFVKRIGRQFLERAPTVFKDMRKIYRELLESEKSSVQSEHLSALSRKAAFLTQMTAMAGYHQTAELSSALEALLFDLASKPAALTDSARQTIASTIAFLANHFDRLEPVAQRNSKFASALVVDDDGVSNLAVEKSLARARFSVTTVTDPVLALEKLRQTHFDVLLLDIAMPGMDGFAVCEQTRQLPLHKRTPVIFITGSADFNSCARSILSGGNDLITKPISPNELCVKVITHLLKGN